MRRLLIALCAIAAIGGCGGSDGGKPEPDALRIALRPAAEDGVAAGHSVRLAGIVDGEPTDPVQIEADPYPFDEFRAVGTAEAKDGSFRFSSKVVVNTRYRAIARNGSGPTTSSPTTIYASPAPTIRAGSRNGVFKATVAVRIPTDLEWKRGPIWLYRSATGLRYVRLGSGRRYRATRGRVGAVITAPLERVHEGDRFIACTRNDYAVGMGRPGLQLERCGDPAFEAQDLPAGGD